MLYGGCDAFDCYGPQCNHFPLLSAPGPQEEVNGKRFHFPFNKLSPCGFLLSVRGFQEAKRQLLVSSFFFLEWLSDRQEVAAVDGGMVDGRLVTRRDVHPQGVNFRRRTEAGGG